MGTCGLGPARYPPCYRSRRSGREGPGLPQLHSAAWRLDANALQQCLDFGADPNAEQFTADPQKYPRLPLFCVVGGVYHAIESTCRDMLVIQRQFETCLVILRTAGADFNMTQREHRSTLLHLSARMELPSWVARGLVHGGCLPGAVDNDGFTAADLAVQLMWEWSTVNR